MSLNTTLQDCGAWEIVFFVVFSCGLLPAPLSFTSELVRLKPILQEENNPIQLEQRDDLAYLVMT